MNWKMVWHVMLVFPPMIPSLVQATSITIPTFESTVLSSDCILLGEVVDIQHTDAEEAPFGRMETVTVTFRVEEQIRGCCYDPALQGKEIKIAEKRLKHSSVWGHAFGDNGISVFRGFRYVAFIQENGDGIFRPTNSDWRTSFLKINLSRMKVNVLGCWRRDVFDQKRWDGRLWMPLSDFRDRIRRGIRHSPEHTDVLRSYWYLRNAVYDGEAEGGVDNEPRLARAVVVAHNDDPSCVELGCMPTKIRVCFDELDAESNEILSAIVATGFRRHTSGFELRGQWELDCFHVASVSWLDEPNPQN